MQLIPMLLKEMEQEAKTTRKMLAAIPTDKFDWQPHPKSMTIRALATHIAELPGWVSMILNTTELDFAKTPYKPELINDTESLLTYFETTLAGGLSSMAKATEEQMEEMWTLRNGDIILSSSTKAEMIRSVYCQVVHHRAQMGVNLRLLNIPIPGSYGPSADEMRS